MPSAGLIEAAQAVWLSLLAFTPSDFHVPTAIITAVLLLCCYLVNRAIAATVSALLPPSTAASSLPSAAALLDFYLLLGRLKTTKRTGWVNHCVPQPESIADHMYRLSLMAFTLSPIAAPTAAASSAAPSAVLMALAHDVGEAVIGDITPPEVSGVSREDKQRLERDAMQQIAAGLGGPHGAQLLQLWEGYEAEAGPTSLLLHDLDKLEMIVQAYEYDKAEVERREAEGQAEEVEAERKGKGKAGRGGTEGGKQQSLARFYESGLKVRDPRVKRIVDEVMRRRALLPPHTLT